MEIDDIKHMVESGIGDLKATALARLDKIAADVKAINKRQDEIETKVGRPRFLASGDNKGDPVVEHKAMGLFAKAGDDTELKAMAVGSDPSGGYVVMPQVSQTIRDVVRDQSPLVRLARVQPMETGDAWEEPIEQDGDWGAAAMGETESRPVTDNAELGVDRYPLNEVYAKVQVTQKLLDLSFVDVGAWIEGRLADRFGRKEGRAYVVGSGVKEAKGLLSYETSAEADFTRPRGKFQHVISGAATSVVADGLRDLYWAVRAPFRTNATWLMASNTANKIDKLKSGDGEYLWRNGMTAGAPPTLLGRPVEFDENFPEVDAGTFPIAFGDIRRGYLIVERQGIKLLRDPFTAKPHVLFYAYKRSGGGAADFHAIKFMKIAAS